MKKFKFLTVNSLMRKIKTKAFLISQIITSIIIIGIAIVPSLLPQDGEVELVEYRVAVVNESNNTDLNTYLENNFAVFGTLEITDLTTFDADGFWDEDNYDILVHYKAPGNTEVDLIDIEQVDYYSKIDSQAGDYLKDLVANSKSILIDLEDYELSLNEKEQGDGPGTTPVDPEDTGLNPVIMGFSTFYFAIVFFFIILSTQSLGAEILEEKSTKAIETIISSVPAEQHFYSKILSSILFTFIQIGLMGVAAVVGFIISKVISNLRGITGGLGISLGSLDIDYLIPSIIIVLLAAILGLILYLILFAFFASFANNNEEYQKAQTPLMMILMVIFYGSLIISGMQLTGLMHVLTYIPFITPFLLPIMLFSGIMAIWEAIIVLLVMLASILIATKVILPAYRISILNYSGDKLIKGVIKSFKASRNNKK